MKVYKVVPRGYCKGVVSAIKIAKQCAIDYPNQPISILGMIVHNQYIVDALKDLRIKTIDQKGKTRLELLDEINEGVVIITAHGAGEDVFDKAKQKGLIVVDATCKDVIKTHDLIKVALSSNKEVLYIGKKGHPEAEGALAINTKKIHLIEKKEDLLNLKDPNQNYIITNQTTMSLWDVEKISQFALKNLPHVKIMKETCNATTIRQMALTKLPEDIDLVYVVGDLHSNNTTRLATIAQENSNALVKRIDSIDQIEIEDLKNKHHVAITSGASTPTYLTNLIIEYLEQFDPNDQNTYVKPAIDYQKILK